MIANDNFNMSKSDRCVNPFRKVGEKGHMGKSLRCISNSMLQSYPHLPKNGKVCHQCRKKFNYVEPENSDDEYIDDNMNHSTESLGNSYASYSMR